MRKSFKLPITLLSSVKMRKISLFLSCICLFLFCSCDSTTDSLFASCCQCGDTLKLSFVGEKMHAGGDHTFFITQDSLSEMQKKIDEMSIYDGELQTELYEHCVLIKKLTPHSLHYYIILNEGGNSYTFTSPKIGLSDGIILFPYHLLKTEDNEWVKSDYNGSVEYRRYEFVGTMESLIEFYEGSNAYKIVQTESSIRFETKRNSEFYGKSYANAPFLLKFESKNGKTFCTFQSEI